MFAMRGNTNWKIRLEKAMAQDAQPLKHRAAKDSRVKQGSTLNIFDHVWLASFYEHFPHWFDQARPLMAVAVAFSEV
jgi:hypothetical protein